MRHCRQLASFLSIQIPFGCLMLVLLNNISQKLPKPSYVRMINRLQF